MTCRRYLIVILVVVMAAACSDTQPAKSLPDNPENRTAVAKRYLEVMAPKELLQGVGKRVTPTLPEGNRKIFNQVLESPEIDKAAYRIMLEALVKDFTAAELNAMTAFYGSPEGQSAWKKFSPYMDAIMPQIQQEVRTAVAEAHKQAEAKEPPTPKSPPGPPAQKAPKAPVSKQ